MRVGISTSVIQRGRSGVGQYVLALLRSLLEAPEEPEIVLFVLRDDMPLFDFARGTVTLVEVEERFRPPVRNIFWHQNQLPRLAREQGLDVLHVPSYRRLLWPRPLPLVGTVHDLAPFRLSGKYDWKRMLYGRVVVRRLAHRQDRLIAVSEETAKDIVKYFGVPPSKVKVIHNGVDHSRFLPGDAERSKLVCRERFGLDRPFFLHVAHLEHPGKNHVRLVDAFEQFKRATQSDCLLAMAGADWHGAEVIHRKANDSPFVSDIRCLGFTPDSDLPDLYRAATAFVYPSLFEGFGMPPLEAMACGCPVISSTRGALGEVVGTAARVVDPEDVSDIARNLTLLATDRKAWDASRALGLGRASRFTWTLAARETLRVYSRACGCTLTASEAATR